MMMMDRYDDKIVMMMIMRFMIITMIVMIVMIMIIMIIMDKLIMMMMMITIMKDIFNEKDDAYQIIMYELQLLLTQYDIE